MSCCARKSCLSRDPGRPASGEVPLRLQFPEALIILNLYNSFWSRCLGRAGFPKRPSPTTDIGDSVQPGTLVGPVSQKVSSRLGLGHVFQEISVNREVLVIVQRVQRWFPFFSLLWGCLLVIQSYCAWLFSSTISVTV